MDIHHVKETEIMTKVDSIKFKTRQMAKRKFNGEVFSRNAIEEALSSASNEVLKKYLTLPPSVPTHRVRIRSIELHSESIFVAGRYCKYSRTIGQTPWVHEDTHITDCVQDYIFRGIEKILGYNKEALTFSASGREDYDVRCLGRGRPFYIQIDDPKTTKITFDTFRRLEQEINKCSEISVRDIQLVNKCDLREIKNGEQFKSKHYTALCVTDCVDITKAVEVLNTYGPFEIKQQTPLRVLHRRTVDTRKRAIHEMRARKIEGRDNMFILDVLTQAGTYVKELVHGDLNRTIPNVSNIVGACTDILALDVISINLDWPPAVTDDIQNGKADVSEKTNGECKSSVGGPIEETINVKVENCETGSYTDVDGNASLVG